MNQYTNDAFGAIKPETRSQTLAAEHKWGDMPIQFVGDEPDTDELISREFIKGALFTLAGVVAGVCIGLAIYFK